MADFIMEKRVYEKPELLRSDMENKLKPSANHLNHPMETIVHYEEVYSEVARIREFLTQDILQSDAYMCNQINDNLEQLHGDANKQFIRATGKQSEKINSILEVLYQLLFFMEQTAFSYDILDKMLSAEIRTDGE